MANKKKKKWKKEIIPPEEKTDIVHKFWCIVWSWYLKGKFRKLQALRAKKLFVVDVIDFPLS